MTKKQFKKLSDRNYDKLDFDEKIDLITYRIFNESSNFDDARDLVLSAYNLGFLHGEKAKETYLINSFKDFLWKCNIELR